ncbi:hypothetical protein L249_4124 [Ophiocordyceps polyrhachis-furcata BCC 54312]|uniref:Uncharacterized protein n=1 Tax=Ophiocordyceps polyrhachis-furcata BCC 54312 TaxID=1330021 RepID=A0A367L592_9HYPO|nr:hypothetical protein L249_4124 [Ophiocordyceps polyrhachis-furcata BCC 54312]
MTKRCQRTDQAKKKRSRSKETRDQPSPMPPQRRLPPSEEVWPHQLPGIFFLSQRVAATPSCGRLLFTPNSLKREQRKRKQLPSSSTIPSTTIIASTIHHIPEKILSSVYAVNLVA